MTNSTETARQATADRQTAAWARLEEARRRQRDAWEREDSDAYRQATVEHAEATHAFNEAQAAALK
jgi:hypothetical protein